MRRLGSFVFLLLVVLGVAAVALVVWDRFSPMRVGPQARQAVNRLEEAAMSRGRYLVQLRSMDIAEQDWTLNALTDGPKPVTLVVKPPDGPEIRMDLGTWRGIKSFDDEPVSFVLNYDPEVPILLEFREPELVSTGRRYTFSEPWPFGRTVLGNYSSCRFSWRRIGPAMPPSTADYQGP